MSARGTTNRNDRGSTTSRRARREYLVETYRADCDAIVTTDGKLITTTAVEFGTGEPACRCYRCGQLLTVDTVTADRIKPGCKGGTYRRDNIRPACGRCNSITGTQVREQMRADKAAAKARRSARRLVVAA